MPRRLLPVLAVVLAALLGSACAGGVSPAVRVDDRTVSHSQMVDELREWAENPEVITSPELVQGPAPGSYSSVFVADLVGFRVERELVLAEAHRRGVEITPELVAEARLAFYGDAETAARIETGWSESYATRILEDIAFELALEAALGEEGFFAWRSDPARTDGVSVSSRFGNWDHEQGRVVPPAGPSRPSAEPDPFAGF